MSHGVDNRERNRDWHPKVCSSQDAHVSCPYCGEGAPRSRRPKYIDSTLRWQQKRRFTPAHQEHDDLTTVEEDTDDEDLSSRNNHRYFEDRHGRHCRHSRAWNNVHKKDHTHASRPRHCHHTSKDQAELHECACARMNDIECTCARMNDIECTCAGMGGLERTCVRMDDHSALRAARDQRRGQGIVEQRKDHTIRSAWDDRRYISQHEHRGRHHRRAEFEGGRCKYSARGQLDATHSQCGGNDHDERKHGSGGRCREHSLLGEQEDDETHRLHHGVHDRHHSQDARKGGDGDPLVPYGSSEHQHEDLDDHFHLPRSYHHDDRRGHHRQERHRRNHVQSADDSASDRGAGFQHNWDHLHYPDGQVHRDDDPHIVQENTVPHRQYNRHHHKSQQPSETSVPREPRRQVHGDNDEQRGTRARKSRNTKFWGDVNAHRRRFASLFCVCDERGLDERLCASCAQGCDVCINEGEGDGRSSLNRDGHDEEEDRCQWCGNQHI